jgi:hypothetical protein
MGCSASASPPGDSLRQCGFQALRNGPSSCSCVAEEPSDLAAKLRAANLLPPRSKEQILVPTPGQSQKSTRAWRRFAQATLEKEGKPIANLCRFEQDDIATARLESERISVTELEESAYRAVMNFSHFYGIPLGSMDPTNCSQTKDDANIRRVVLSSAGLRGWAEANIGAPAYVMTLHAVGEDADGIAEIACFTIAGNSVAVRFASDSTVGEFRTQLANQLHVHASYLKLILPNAEMLTELDNDKQICLVLANSAAV